MTYDIHVHLAGTNRERNGNYINPRLTPVFRYLLRRLGMAPDALWQPGADERFRDGLLEWIERGGPDRVVVLALDAAYRRDGSRNDDVTRLTTANDYVASLAAQHPRVLFGASVHPYRHDALAELERVVARGACLVKWIPSAQGIAPDHPACFPFYEALARHGLPLLTHTGREHTLSAFPNDLNHPRRLKPALECGVTVIGAHCGTRLFLHDCSHFRAWRAMVLRHDGFYGDISAFGVVTRTRALACLQRDPRLLAKIVYGSDFPAPTSPWGYVLRLGWRQTRALSAEPNPLERPYRLCRSLGLPHEVFSRAGRLLRLPTPAGTAPGGEPR